MEKELTVRRSWPWKKKFNDRFAASPEFKFGGTSPTPPKLFDEQELTRILEDQSRVADEALHEADEKAKAMAKKLEMALSEIAAKDQVVKEHIKVAEDAVIGWEKAEVEAAEFKTQLDAAKQQKLGLEDRVKHLEGALKGCTHQLRVVREEQEQCIHEIVVKKTREYDELRAEMNAKLAEASQLLSHTCNELTVSRADANALTLALKERTADSASLGEAKQCLEMEIRVLKVKLDGVEKDNVTLKHENQILKKDIEMHKGKCEYQQKALDSVSQQNVENVKTIAKLEAECTRLRIALNRKLPSGTVPASRTKQEMNPQGKERGRVSVRGHGGMDAKRIQKTQEHGQENSGAENLSEADILAKKIMAMEEEVVTLKGALDKRTEELQASRIMCAKTASQLSAVEEQLEAAMRAGTPSSGIGRDSDMWAVVPFVEHDESNTDETLKRRDSHNMELMDDFVEMERLAVLQSETAMPEAGVETASVASLQQQLSDLEKALADKDQDLQARSASLVHLQHQVDDLEKALEDKAQDLQTANESCRDLNLRLADSAEQIAALQACNDANETSMSNLQVQLDGLIAEQEGGGGAWSLSNHKDVPEGLPLISEAELKGSIAQSELTVALSKLVQTIEVLAQAAAESEYFPSALEQLDINATGHIAASMHWKDFQIESALSNLIRVTNNLLQGKTEIVNFIVELAIALNSVMVVGDFCSLKQQVSDSVNERIASTTDLEIAKEEIANFEEELQMARAEQAAFESHVQAELERFTDIESQIDHLSSEKRDLELSLSEANQQVKDLKEQLQEVETLLEDYRRQEDLERKEDEMMEDELLELSSSNPGLASCLRVAEADMNQLNEKVAALEVELHRERNRHQEVVAKLEDLQEQIHRGAGHSEHSGSSHGREIEWSQQSMSDDDDMKTARKEREIAAAALAECQRTILALGKQLKVLGIQDLPDASLTATASPTSIQTMTQTMELLRWQTQAVDGMFPGKDIPWSSTPKPRAQSPIPVQNSPDQNGSHSPYRGFPQTGNNGVRSPHSNFDDRVSIPAFAPAQSDLSVPGNTLSTSVLRSVRTLRANSMLKATNGTNFSTNGDNSLLENPGSLSTVSRFYSRSHSETSESN